eukprot:3282285-Amphidinium_carterae.1
MWREPVAWSMSVSVQSENSLNGVPLSKSSRKGTCIPSIHSSGKNLTIAHELWSVGEIAVELVL